MSFNGSGTFLINTAGQPVVSGTVISSTAFNSLTADLATGLSTAITKDGQTTVTANIPMSTYKFTGLGVGSAATDSANLSQVQSTVTKLLASVSGADTITATASPTLAAYAAGQMFYFVAAGDNTTSVTLNIDSLGAKAVTRDGSVALAAADIKSGEVIVVVYDGTRFQVVSQLNSAGDARFANVSIASSLYVGGVSTFVGNAGFSANVSIASALSVGGVAAITGATTIGGNLTLSGGTANGVLYLNGSKVATSGSALTFNGSVLDVTGTITADGLTVDGVVDVNGGQIDLDTGQPIRWGGAASSIYAGSGTSDMVFTVGSSERFRVNGSSGNLGIGTASPGSRLTVSNSSGGNVAAFTNTSSADLNINLTAGVTLLTPSTGTLAFGTSSTERMRLDSSGNLGIGTASPVYRIDALLGAGSGNIARFGQSGVSNGYVITTNGSALTHEWANGGSVSMAFTSSGNLGLGVTPSASSVKTFEINNVGNTLSGLGGGDIALMSNAYFDSGFKYAGSNLATSYRQQDGIHKWFIAPSGTAGNAISFTQAMTLDASGNLLVGLTTGAKFSVSYGGNDTHFGLGANYDNYITAGSSGITVFRNASTERARITSGGDFVVNGTTTLNTNAKLSVVNSAGGAFGIATGYSTTSGQFRLIYLNNTADALSFDNGNNSATLTSGGTWTNASDARLKKNIQQIKYGLDTVLAAQPRSFNRVDVGGEYIGFIAQELQAQIPEVVYGNEDTKYSVDYGSLVAVAFRAIQEQQAIITALTARITALESK